jgi:CRISPR-associated exonuclease Cas4
MHKEKKPKEYVFEKIKVDDIIGDSLIEYKKTSSNLKGTRFQVLHYLSFFESKGIKVAGIVKDLTYSDEHKVILDDNSKEELNKLYNEINNMLLQDIPNKKSSKKNCKGCSFIDYCWVE